MEHKPITIPNELQTLPVAQPRPHSLQPCSSRCREANGWEEEQPREVHNIIKRTLTEAQKRKMKEPEGYKQRRKEERQWEADWAEEAAAAEQAARGRPGVKVSHSRGDQRQQEQREGQQQPPLLSSPEVRGGCNAIVSSRHAACLAKVSVPLHTACLPAISSRTWALLFFFLAACMATG